MSRFYTNTTDNYGKEINYKELTNILNNLLPNKEHGVLLDCIVPRIRNVDYPHGLSKPIPFLKAVNLEGKFMIIMVEYKLYIPEADNDQELALEIDKSKFRVFKKEEEISFIFQDDKSVKLKLHNSFDFPYHLSSETSIPTLELMEWIESPFI